MTNIIDRRNTYNKDKNSTNRKRYIDRIKDQVKNSVNQKVEKGSLSDLVSGDKVKVKVKNNKEPIFQQDYETGENDRVVPGNETFETGDLLPKPRKGRGGGGPKASEGEDGEDDFTFVLTREEYLNILFEDLELPDLVKKEMLGADCFQLERRGYTSYGNPSTMDLARTARNALGRRIALKRPTKTEIEKLEKEHQTLLDVFMSKGTSGELTEEEFSKELAKIDNLLININELKSKQKKIPFYDPADVKYRRFDKIPAPICHAVMFAIMDVSGSMGDHEKDIAKRFFLLLYLFLTQKYEKVEIRFIRHTTTAEEVDENTFFYDPLSGGTLISPALELVNDIIDKEYNVSKTNIYISQATDGDNMYHDNQRCHDTIVDKLLKKIQYFAFIEIFNSEYRSAMSFFSDLSKEEEDGLWSYYQKISNGYPQMQCRKIGHKRNIFQVFAELFKKKEEVV